MLIQKEHTVKFRDVLFQAATISTAPRIAVAMVAVASTFVLAGCGGGGSPNSAAPPPDSP